MPTVFRWNGFRFYFFSNEGSPREPVHIHVERDGGEAKLWLYPEVRIADCVGFSRSAQADLVRIVEARRQEIERAWNEHFR
ncbi:MULTISPECIES: DUF4160 domain-containing protein [Nitrospirillum]|uniref:Uncharacterized protein DUF4160 n=1 Tax=Nitrospirillum amazonense TaxID=28077 RepID=A0A560FA92_9PROT|nr:DUF4160 domain-containing protein [Nitrospirillum amazonense]MEC4595117.1 DUF4160 domain-containing protein [Nitrospirillum amazonense]TWB18539.1 uncharacterized protein DUF4160 [Nitrospirillum amazonense]